MGAARWLTRKSHSSEASTNSPSNEIANGSQKLESEADFPLGLKSAVRCFTSQSLFVEGNFETTWDSIKKPLEQNFGEIISVSDRWIEKTIQNSKGEERRIRLEITETDEGKIGKEIHIFKKNDQGLWSPAETVVTTPENVDAEIEKIWSEGQVTHESKAVVGFFKNSFRFEYVLNAGLVKDFGIYNEPKKFTCEDLANSKTCKCN